MAITSTGYPNTIAPGSAFALMGYAFGRQYAAPFVSHCQVTDPGSGTRRVQISTGYLAGKHIVDHNDAIVNIDLPNASGSSQWFCIVLNRWVDAGGGDFKSEFGYVAGTSAKAIPALTQNPGIYDQQPIALVRISSTQTRPQEIIDLRPIAEEPGTYTIYDDLALQVIDRPGVTAYNAKTGITYRRVYNENSAREWQRVWDAPHGQRPHLVMYRDTPFSSAIATSQINLYGGTKNAQVADAATYIGYSYGASQQAQAAANPAKLTIKQDGVYAIAMRLSITPTVSAHFGVALNEYAPSGAPAIIAAPYNRQYVYGQQSTEFFLGETRFFHAGTEIRPTMGQNGSTFLVGRWYLWATRLSD
jgi:hypothetical protein